MCLRKGTWGWQVQWMHDVQYAQLDFPACPVRCMGQRQTGNEPAPTASQTGKGARENVRQHGVGGQLQSVLMQHPPQLSVKTCRGAGAVEAGGGVLAAWPGGGSQGRGPVRDPLLPHAYLKGGCVSGGMGV